MAILGTISIYIVTLLLGFLFQALVRWSPRVILGISFLLALFLPPGWGIGLVEGLLITCAFFTYEPLRESQFDQTPTVSWQKILLTSLWTFAGFLLTLLFLLRFKLTGSINIQQGETLAWIFLILVEVCLYKVIVKDSFSLYRIPLGFGIAVLNFLMILYWIYPLGWSFIGLVFFSLLIINPLLLIWIDIPLVATGDPFLRRR